MKESIEENKERSRPKYEDRNIWRELTKAVGGSDADKILDIAVYLYDHGEKEKAEELRALGCKVEGQNFKEEAEKLLEGFKDNDKDNSKELDS